MGVSFGVDEFLFIGGGIHIGILFIICIFLCSNASWKIKDGYGWMIRDLIFGVILCLYWIYSFLFSVPWNIVGAMLYSETDITNACTDITLAVVVIRFIEFIGICILMMAVCVAILST